MRVGQRRRCAFRAAILFLVTLLTGAVASAQDKRILLLYDEDKPGLAILDQSSLRSTFSAGLGTSVQFFSESMNLSQFTDEHYEQVLREHYSKKYRDKKLDLVVGVMGPALGFLLRHGDAVFPGVPVIFCGADAADIEGITLPAHVTGLLVKRVFAPTLDVALGLQPETRHVAVIGGTSPFDRHLGEQARRELKAFEGRVSFEYFTELSMVDHLLHPGHLRLVGLTLRSGNSSASSRRARSPSPSRTRTCRRRSLPTSRCACIASPRRR